MGTGGIVVGVLVDTDFYADGVGVSDSIFAFAVSTVPSNQVGVDGFDYVCVVDEVVGGGSSIAAVEIAVVGPGSCAGAGIACIVDDDVFHFVYAFGVVVSYW